MIRAYFKGGPKDGEMIALPEPMGVFMVYQPPPLAAVLAASAPVSECRKGMYELVTRDKDPLWRLGRRYQWKGWL